MDSSITDEEYKSILHRANEILGLSSPKGASKILIKSMIQDLRDKKRDVYTTNVLHG